jgi:hypothetical protein
MGVNDRAQDKRENKKAVSEVNRRRRPQSSTSNGVADWGGVPGVLLVRAVATVA